jgi:hypothetical protein
MHMMHRRVIFAFTGAALAASLLVVALPASAATKLKVSPSKNLTAGKTVKVSGTGFTPGDGVYILQCIIGDNSDTGSGCNLNNLKGPITISSKGVLATTEYTVSSGAIGTDGGTCGTTKANASACDISVGNPSGGDTGTLKITFKIPK